MRPSSTSTKREITNFVTTTEESLLAIAGKMLARVMLNRLIVHLEHGSESLCCFRGGRGTVDMIFAARQLQEKCQEQYDDLFITLIDLTNSQVA